MSLKEKLISKSIYLLCLAGMCLGLFGVAYIFFLKTYDIDVTAHIDIIYTGESGSATAKVVNNTDNINQRTEAFMESLTFDVEPDTNLANGETILITAHYNEELAGTYHYNPVQTTREIIVEGLSNRYESRAVIPQEYLGKLQDQASRWLLDNRETVFTSVFNRQPEGSLSLEIDPIYSAFLKSKSRENTDKFICIYDCSFLNDHTRYPTSYLVCIPGVNDSQKTDLSSIFGEKAYLQGNESVKDYILRVYGGKYEVEMVYQKEETPVANADEEEADESQDDEEDFADESGE